MRTAYAEILASAKAYAPQARITGVSVQEMVGQGVEAIIGVSCDPQLGRCSCSVVAACRGYVLLAGMKRQFFLLAPSSQDLGSLLGDERLTTRGANLMT